MDKGVPCRPWMTNGQLVVEAELSLGGIGPALVEIVSRSRLHELVV